MHTHRIWLFAVVILTACSGMTAPTPTASATITLAPPTGTASLTPTVTATRTPTLTPTATWVPQGPGHIQVPIFMFHHIGVSPIGSRFYVTPETFESHLMLLRDWGYATISTSTLVEAITAGTAMPPRPIIITFDDANLDNYTNAFPLMQQYGFTGVLYVPAAYVGQPNYLSAEQIQEMAAAGWEVGSHTITHPTNLLNAEPAVMRREIVGSRQILEELLGLPILTFAYPFGLNSGGAVDYVHFAGYIAGMGATGYTADQGTSNLFVLQRIEIRGSETADSITRFLPWHGDASVRPADAAAATVTPAWSPTP